MSAPQSGDTESKGQSQWFFKSPVESGWMLNASMSITVLWTNMLRTCITAENAFSLLRFLTLQVAALAFFLPAHLPNFLLRQAFVNSLNSSWSASHTSSAPACSAWLMNCLLTWSCDYYIHPQQQIQNVNISIPIIQSELARPSIRLLSKWLWPASWQISRRCISKFETVSSLVLKPAVWRQSNHDVVRPVFCEPARKCSMIPAPLSAMTLCFEICYCK